MGKWKYGVVLDAGSSGTRAYVYRWLNPEKALKGASKEQANGLPEIITKKDWGKKIKPGLSTFADNPKGMRHDYMDKLVKHINKYVPEEEVEGTPLYMLATAGMRQLTLKQQKEVMLEACTYLQESTRFRIPNCANHVQVMTGETEGLYGWIASNYLLNAFNDPETHAHGEGHHTYGFLEMGGASTQLAFVPNATESHKHFNDLTHLRLRKINGEDLEYRLFVATWLGYGSTEARRRYVDSLIKASGSSERISDPCLLKGLQATKDYKEVKHGSTPKDGPILIGTGNFAECMNKTNPLLNDNAPCPDKPCLMDGKHVPAFDFNVNHFVGISRFHDIAHEIPDLFKSKDPYDFEGFKVKVEQFCNRPWDAISASVEKGEFKKMDNDDAIEACFSASWLINMVHDGFDLPKADPDVIAGKLNTTKSYLSKTKGKGFLDPFQTTNKIHDVDINWTLGTAVILAAADIPSGNESLPVGFGPNTGSTWIDFEAKTKQGLEAEGEDWHDKLFKDSPRRVPGLIIFLLIVVLLLYFLSGRERRSSWYSKMMRNGSPGKRRRFPGHKLFGFKRSEQAYESLEAGTAAADFELGDFASDDDSHSDSSETARRGRASGWATPQINVGLDSAPLVSPGYKDNVAGSSAAAQAMPGIGSVLGRSGRISRSESKEKLTRSESKEKLFGSNTSLTAMGLHGRGSRAGSPTRMRSPLMSPLKENVD